MRRALLLASLWLPVAAGAQQGQAITDNNLLDPWRQATAVLNEVVATGSVLPDAGGQAAVLASALDDLRRDLEETAISIAARPEFAYDAAQRSADLSRQVARVGEGLEQLYSRHAIAERPDVRAACNALDRLREILAARNLFERDVLAIVGSGSKNAIQALAARWWTAAERVGDLRDAVAGLAGEGGQ